MTCGGSYYNMEPYRPPHLRRENVKILPMPLSLKLPKRSWRGKVRRLGELSKLFRRDADYMSVRTYMTCMKYFTGSPIDIPMVAL